MWKYYLALDKYWMTHDGYFIIGTTVALGMGITYAKLLFFHGTVHLVSLDGLVFNVFNFFKTKGTAALTCMFGDVCSYVHGVTW